MKRSYVLIFNDLFAARDKVTDLLDTFEEIINWRSDTPSSVFLVSELSAKEISEKIAVLNVKPNDGKKGFYMVTEISSNKQGWLPKQAWRMINEKHAPGE